MKRPFIFAFLILLFDQGLKTYFQIMGKEYYFLNYFGFKYVVNYALWINPNLKNKTIYYIFLFAFLVWILAIILLKKYQDKYRKSIIVDFAFGFYSVGILGNMMDKIIFGYIRDFFMTPYAICNLADLCGFIGILLFGLELIIYPKSRELLKFSKN